MIDKHTLGIVSDVYTNKLGTEVVDVTCPICYRLNQNVAKHFINITCFNCGGVLHQTEDTIELKKQISYIDLYIVYSVITRLRSMNIYCWSEYSSGDKWVHITVSSSDLDKLYDYGVSVRKFSKVRRKLRTTKMGGHRTINMSDILPYVPDFPYKSFDTIVYVGEGLSTTYKDKFPKSGLWVFKWRDTSDGSTHTRTFANKDDAYKHRDFLQSLAKPYTIAYQPVNKY